MESYLQGQDLWDTVNGSDTTPPEDPTALKKWKIRAGKAMFAIKTTIEEEMLEHIREAKTPKDAWSTFAALFSKKNDARLQLLENELLSIKQGEMTINQYFTKVKSLCREIATLDSSAGMSDSRIRRIIIHGLRQEYRSFIAAIQGWPTQPSLVALENLLADQEALAKQIAGASSKNDEEALFTNNRGRPSRNDHWRKRKDGCRDQEERSQLGGAQRGDDMSGESHHNRRFDGTCYNCGKRGHIARNCWSKKKPAESNVVTSSAALTRDDEWDMEALLALNEEEHDFETSTSLDEEEWDFEAPTMVIHDAHEDEPDVEVSSVEDVYGEEVELKPSKEGEPEKQGNAEKIQEKIGKLPEAQSGDEQVEKVQELDVDENYPTQSSWQRRVERETTRPSDLEEISESQEEFEEFANQQFQRSSRARKSKLGYVNVGAIGEETFGDMFPEELSLASFQKLREQLKIRKRKSVSRGSIEHRSLHRL